MTVRVRFSPSPTGLLHVGSVRTALYNWLFARHHDGVAILRIEDTDTEREHAGAVDQIQRSLDWLGLDWDEGPAVGGPGAPYFQSQRGPYYSELADRLLASGAAYHCYQSPDELSAAREAARQTDDPASPTRAHRDLTREQIAAFEAAGRRPAIRLRVPVEGATEIVDVVAGPVRFEHRLLGDHVLVRPDGRPTYQFANPADDLASGITHIIRGDDLLPSTPRQKLLVDALGGAFPRTAHLPMILGPDRKRLSKRHGATSVEELQAAGFIPEAIVNYLALLGWSFDDSTEVMSIAELVQRFTLERVKSSPAIFDHQKLAWMNGMHLRGLEPDVYADRLRAYLRDAGSDLADLALDPVVPLVQDKIGTLAEFDLFAGALLRPDRAIDDAALSRVRAQGESRAVLDATVGALDAIEGWSVEAVEAALRTVCASLDLSPRHAFLAPRVAVSGRTVSPGLFESIQLLGRDETVRRLRDLEARLR